MGILRRSASDLVMCALAISVALDMKEVWQ